MRRWIWTRRFFEWDEDAQQHRQVDGKSRGYWYDGPVAKGMDTPTMRQFHFQFFNDDGTDETDSTTKALIDIDITGQLTDENFLVRFVVDETAGNANTNYSCQLQVRNNVGTYQPVTGSSTLARSFDSTKLTDGNATTQRTGAGSFITTNKGQDDVDGAAGGQSPDYLGSDECEFVFCVQARNVDLADLDELDFRLDPADIDTFAVAFGRVTISKPAGAVPLFFDHLAMGHQ